MREKIEVMLASVRQWGATGTAREKFLVLAALLVIVGYLSYEIVSSVSAAFTKQTQSIEQIERDLRALPFVVERFAKAQQRQRVAEESLSSMLFTGRARTHLERLLKSKDKIAPGYRIDQGNESSIGDNYLETSLTVGFRIGDFEQLVQLLNEIVSEPEPLILKNISIDRIGRGQQLSVSLQVSSISQK